MINMNSCAAMHRNHFHGNGNCDETREANKRADRVTGMESEIAPYYGAENGAMGAGQMTANGAAMGHAMQSGTAMSQTAPYGGTWSPAEQQSAARQNASMNAMMPRNGANTAAQGYDDSEYGPDHEWTVEEEDGMNSLPQDSFDDPLSAGEAARNSWRALLARNVGRNVLVRFLMGTQNLITVEGELYEVGTDYIVIYQPLWDSHITADLYSVKFVEFREPPGVMTLN